MSKTELKREQETIRKINECYQTYDYSLEVRFPMPNGCYLSFVTYYQEPKQGSR